MESFQLKQNLQALQECKPSSKQKESFETCHNKTLFQQYASTENNIFWPKLLSEMWEELQGKTWTHRIVAWWIIPTDEVVNKQLKPLANVDSSNTVVINNCLAQAKPVIGLQTLLLFIN